MDARKMVSFLGVGLMVVVMLSMFAVPVMATSVSLKTVSHDIQYMCVHGSLHVYVKGYYTLNDLGNFTGGRAWYANSGYTVTNWNAAIYLSIVYAAITGCCNTCGRTVHMSVWVSPLIYNPYKGGSMSWQP
ncbi:MAG: hypothetical protein LBE76_05030 [Nitrososphaerota archaeon]|jgi:hypothetical protein|nr:hypothetical protein [Nitrososphaerota archaeon]